MCRKFKRPFFLIGAISPAWQVVNRLSVYKNPNGAPAGLGGVVVGDARVFRAGGFGSLDPLEQIPREESPSSASGWYWIVAKLVLNFLVKEGSRSSQLGTSCKPKARTTILSSMSAKLTLNESKTAPAAGSTVVVALSTQIGPTLL
jgi:hypothetical protein